MYTYQRPSQPQEFYNVDFHDQFETIINFLKLSIIAIPEQKETFDSIDCESSIKAIIFSGHMEKCVLAAYVSYEDLSLF